MLHTVDAPHALAQGIDTARWRIPDRHLTTRESSLRPPSLLIVIGVSDARSRVATRSDIHTLHRYWIWADQMRLLFAAELNEVGSQFDADGAIHRDAYMSLWYALLAVVIEGWNELQLCQWPTRSPRFWPSKSPHPGAIAITVLSARARGS